MRPPSPWIRVLLFDDDDDDDDGGGSNLETELSDDNLGTCCF